MHGLHLSAMCRFSLEAEAHPAFPYQRRSWPCPGSHVRLLCWASASASTWAGVVWRLPRSARSHQPLADRRQRRPHRLWRRVPTPAEAISTPTLLPASREGSAERWLNGIPCKAPAPEGITRGMSAGGSCRYLERSPFAKDVVVGEAPFKTEWRVVAWDRLNESGPNGMMRCDLTIPIRLSPR